MIGFECFALVLPLQLVSADIRISFWLSGDPENTHSVHRKQRKNCNCFGSHIYFGFVHSAKQNHLLNHFKLGFLTSAYQAVLKTSCFWQHFCSLCLNSLNFSGCQAKQFVLAVFAWLFSKMLHIPEKWIRCLKKIPTKPEKASSWVLCGHFVFNIDLWTESWFYTVLLNHFVLGVWCFSFRLHGFPWVYTANIMIW